MQLVSILFNNFIIFIIFIEISREKIKTIVLYKIKILIKNNICNYCYFYSIVSSINNIYYARMTYCKIFFFI